MNPYQFCTLSGILTGVSHARRSLLVHAANIGILHGDRGIGDDHVLGGVEPLVASVERLREFERLRNRQRHCDLPPTGQIGIPLQYCFVPKVRASLMSGDTYETMEIVPEPRKDLFQVQHVPHMFRLYVQDQDGIHRGTYILTDVVQEGMTIRR
jgi:hypothetical protein